MDELNQRLKKIKLLALDVDGILTDCRLWMDTDGSWKRFYSIRDGLGIKRLQEMGYEVAIITASNSEDVRARAKVLGITRFYEGAHQKESSFADLLQKTGLKAEEVAYMGDDLPDLPLLRQVGFAATAPEALEEVKLVVQYISKRPGGNGAVREVCEMIIKNGAKSLEVKS
ncbi:MAG TPA: HAD-IIIA family hydrolase [Pseudobdellovibrionaceae bacterium]|nr:HAD-IIIA family hydrolase [Pseudobdellovibrionaceae bacterium]